MSERILPIKDMLTSDDAHEVEAALEVKLAQVQDPFVTTPPPQPPAGRAETQPKNRTAIFWRPPIAAR